MNGFLNLRTGSKLLAAFGLIVALLVLVLLTAQRGIADTERSFAFAAALNGIGNNLNENRASILSLLEAKERETQQTLLEEIRANARQSEELQQQVERFAANDGAFASDVARLDTLRSEYNRTRDDRSIPLIVEGRLEEARTLSSGVQHQRYLALRALSSDLSERALQRGREQARRALLILFSVGALAVLAALAIVWLLTRLIAAPLRELTHIADRIAAGDLDINLRADDRRDEVGQLAQSFARMTATLKAMAAVAERIADGDLGVTVVVQSERDVLGRALQTMVGNLRQLLGNLTAGIATLSSAVRQISASTSQFTVSAAETAAAVSQTTTTVEEVKQTAQVSSQKARHVSESAQRVAQISDAGQRSTAQAEQGMSRIQQQMEAIADAMVRLSEQSAAVGQIVASVEDLAVQSKLLAVNASIEAAKAGDHGKGFAVVAQEVKSLAEQSKQATAQVRNILGDIQKATSAAVMATEQGSHAVSAGQQQSQQAGQAIQALAGSVADAAQAAAQIAASSQQQLVGVDQVASAMENIRQASSQNAISARQLESSAVDLQSLSEKLKRATDAYTVTE